MNKVTMSKDYFITPMAEDEIKNAVPCTSCHKKCAGIFFRAILNNKEHSNFCSTTCWLRVNLPEGDYESEIEGLEKS